MKLIIVLFLTHWSYLLEVCKIRLLGPKRKAQMGPNLSQMYHGDYWVDVQDLKAIWKQFSPRCTLAWLFFPTGTRGIKILSGIRYVCEHCTDFCAHDNQSPELQIFYWPRDFPLWSHNSPSSPNWGFWWFLAATKQLYEWQCLPVCLSVCLSHLFHYVPIILSSWNIKELLPLTKVISMQKVNVRGQRSRTQMSKPNLGVSGLELQFEFTYDDEMMHQAWYCLRKVRYCFSRSSVKFQRHTAKKSSILTQIGCFRTVTPVRIHQWLRNDAQNLKWHRRGALLFFKVICQISRSHG